MANQSKIINNLRPHNKRYNNNLYRASLGPQQTAYDVKQENQSPVSEIRQSIDQERAEQQGTKFLKNERILYSWLQHIYLVVPAWAPVIQWEGNLHSSETNISVVYINEQLIRGKGRNLIYTKNFLQKVQSTGPAMNNHWWRRSRRTTRLIMYNTGPCTIQQEHWACDVLYQETTRWTSIAGCLGTSLQAMWGAKTAV